MEYTKFEKMFLDNWSSTNFNKWKEIDIREDFIAPLLNILGYSKDTTNDIIREQSLSLSKSFHRIGRKRVSIDYIPTVRLKQFWIIEAKPGNKKQMDYGDLLQAHLYARHPEVQANFIVLINGWEIRIYDALYSDSWEDPLLICKQEDCYSSFHKLKDMIGAQNMLEFQRQRILSIIKDSFEVEIDEKQVSLFKSEVNNVLRKSLSKVKDNANQLKLNAWKEAEKKEKEDIKKLKTDLLLVRMDIPTNRMFFPAKEYLRRIINSNMEEKENLIDKLVMKYRGRPHAIFRVQSLYIFVQLLKNNIDINSTNYVSSIKSSIEELALSNFKYWNRNKLSNALCHLDNTAFRLAKKLSVRIAMDSMKNHVQELNDLLSVEDQLKENHTVSRHMVGYINFLGENLWRLFCSSNKSEHIWNGIWLLETIEKIVMQIPKGKYPNNNSDLLFFESYGLGYDMLFMGTWDILQSDLELLKDFKINMEVINYASLSREEAISKIPKSIDSPKEWKPEKELLNELMSKFSLKNE